MPDGPAGLPARRGADRTLVMGVLNVTPDSFSDGGQHFTTAEAVAHGSTLLRHGADLIDVGGESTRPGAERVSEQEELRRVLPVVRALADQGAVLSVDTMRAAVAEEVIAAGAFVINDVSAGLADPEMATAVADLRTTAGTPPVFVATHWRGHSDVMNDLADYTDVPADVSRELDERVVALQDAGLPREHLVVDPGLGFAKTGAQNWDLLADWETLSGHGLPVLIGGSRKRFLGALDVDTDAATAALTTISALHGAWAVRVHDVLSSVAAATVAERYLQAKR